MKRVVVAMSGGVDSSVAAALLKEQGYEVLGMMLRLWSEPGKEDSNRCCTPDAMALARRVAAQLDIPFYAVDARQPFRSTVVQYFLDGYALGVTPNPCLVCNREIRWKFLLDHAKAMGADYMATGHYVKLREQFPAGLDSGTNSTMQLLRADDRSKDQSYVLHVLNQNQLRSALFPIGNYSKDEIRSMAKGFSLPSASRPDSQDLCFLAGEDYRRFIKRNDPESLVAGEIRSVDGRLLGRHSGLSQYTIGQRKGLGFSSSQPMYVLDKIAETNTLLVGFKDDLGRNELTVKNLNWISETPPPETFWADVKIRYTARETPAEVTRLQDGTCQVRFDDPQRDITPGQAAVFYQDDLVLGGGIIV
ncbi:MAG TPA: tRNA 2-thiouridine(34) synthase MnmA [Anaerolineales bacterium]|nr:tRNA 2-thiouridine(34) synthase MnmA [Anaerolineales bacterium]